jgi:hypothetical protein
LPGPASLGAEGVGRSAAEPAENSRADLSEPVQIVFSQPGLLGVEFHAVGHASMVVTAVDADSPAAVSRGVDRSSMPTTAAVVWGADAPAAGCVDGAARRRWESGSGHAWRRSAVGTPLFITTRHHHTPTSACLPALTLRALRLQIPSHICVCECVSCLAEIRLRHACSCQEISLRSPVGEGAAPAPDPRHCRAEMDPRQLSHEQMAAAMQRRPLTLSLDSHEVPAQPTVELELEAVVMVRLPEQVRVVRQLHVLAEIHLRHACSCQEMLL